MMKKDHTFKYSETKSGLSTAILYYQTAIYNSLF